ncbi:10532_t:CDS:2 [Paraglomus occultum]|uniref:10532_t:CDS:1 n=1 Tax=Paraglomus occultum TaxID=144539 RepID=A0A9N8ZGT8_9GLOM|nr:10532_t:CDS:2 [Paraglomus occultum]
MIKTKTRKLRKYLRRIFARLNFRKHQRRQTSFSSISLEVSVHNPDTGQSPTSNKRPNCVDIRRRNSIIPLAKPHNSDASRSKLSIHTKPETTQLFGSSTLKRAWRRPPSPPSYMLVVPDPADVFIPVIKLTPVQCSCGCSAQHGYSPTDVQEINTNFLDPYFQVRKQRNATRKTRSNDGIQQ